MLTSQYCHSTVTVLLQYCHSNVTVMSQVNSCNVFESHYIIFLFKLLKYSEKMIDQLLINNGYNDRVLDTIKDKRKRRKRSNQKVQNKDQDGAILKLP